MATELYAIAGPLLTLNTLVCYKSPNNTTRCMPRIAGSKTVIAITIEDDKSGVFGHVKAFLDLSILTLV